MTTRRQFLTQSLAATSVLGFPAFVHSRSPNQKVNLAFIGTGGRGNANLSALTKNMDLVNVVGLCDVNRQTLQGTMAKFPGAKGYQDFRKLYEQKDVDAYVVSVAEHTHALATLPALKNKKPVYCEKPLTHNVHEAKVIMEAAAKAGVATQMGTQIHGMPNYRRVVELVQSGAIGQVKECHVWVDRAWGIQSEEDAKANHDLLFITERPKEIMTPPEYLDWDLWLGPAPYRPYHECYFPGPKWYRWWDFGNGTMSDLGSHWNDLPWWALNLDAPVSVEASSPFGPAHAEIAPATMTARYEYAARGTRGPVTLYWHQGSSRPPIWNENAEVQKFKSGVVFIGEKGILVSDYGKHKLLPESQYADFTPPKPTIPDSPGQHEQWLNAIINGGPTDSPFDTYAGPLTIANHLGNVAFRVGKKLEWDAVNLKATNAPEADVYLNRVPRKGWELSA